MGSYPYTCPVEAEPLHRYRPGGYHPVHLGDLLKNDRYKILHKLGFGAYSTVWAAKDQELQRYVAIKISVSETGSESRELQILRTLSAHASASPGSQHVMQLLDDFRLTGPNGTHNCLVLELLGPNVPTVIEERFADGRLSGELAKDISKQALQGLDFLHQLGIGHGDLHTGNIAFTVPLLDSLSEESFIDNLHTPQTGKVTQVDGRALEPGIPEYLVWPTSLPVSNLTSASSIKIVDFGESFLNENKPETLHTPLVVRAPEVIFDDYWDYRVDLWSMGCMMFELVVGQPPFDSIMITKATLVSQMIVSLGKLPEKWLNRWDAMRGEEPAEGEGCDLQKWLEETYFDSEKEAQFTHEDITHFGTLLRKMLRFDPFARIPASEILKDDWFQDK